MAGGRRAGAAGPLAVTVFVWGTAAHRAVMLHDRLRRHSHAGESPRVLESSGDVHDAPWLESLT